MSKGKGSRARAEDVALTADEASGKSASERARDREPREGLRDEASLKHAESPEDEPQVDESQERNEAVTAAQDVDEPLGLRSVKDGGYEGEELPTVRVGEVYESMRPDDHRRYVKILSVDEADGKVLVQNEETYHKSRIDPERFVPSAGWWRRFAS